MENTTTQEGSNLNMSPTIGELAKALSKAQGKMSHATKDTDNVFFRSKYADLASVVDASRPALVENGLSVVQCTEGDKLWTMLMHESGEWVKGYIELKPMKQVKDKGWEESHDPQSYGSCITYARRYAMAAITGVATEDDDGNAASGNKTSPPPAPSTSAAPQGAGVPGTVPAPPPTPGELDEQGMRDELAVICESLSIAGGVPVTEVLRTLTENKDKKFGKSYINDIPFKLFKKDKTEWSPLAAVLSKARKELEGIAEEPGENGV